MKNILTILLFGACSISALADVRLPDVIGSSMVLQQKMKVPIWGTAEPGESVTVTFAKQKKTVAADANGKWRIDLDKMPANAEPEKMTIEGKNSIVLENILVGEVWFVSGQSNMQWTLLQANNGEREVAGANHPNLRLFNTRREVGFKRTGEPIGRWAACTPESVKAFSGIGYYFAVDLQRQLKVPVGVINSSWGGSQAEAWTPVEYLNASPELKATVERSKIWDEERARVRVEYAAAIEQWRKKADEQKAAVVKPSPSPPVPDSLRDYRVAASIYEGMVAPIIPFAIRGAAWYQGESNESRAEQYGILLPTMIRAWRERWGHGDFPFAIIQLPNYRQVKPEPEESPWSFIREVQRRTALRTPNAGLIVTIDIGEASDIHPKNKLDVGNRLARWALKDVYGRKILNEPVVVRVDAKNGKVVLSFADVGSGLRLRDGEKLDEFAVAGDDKKWYWAEAKIIGKNRVEVSSPNVPDPKAVRYAFNSNPQHPNLTNDSGLPVSPFRTDDWPDPTAGKR